MANVYVEARPKGRAEGSAVEGYVIEDHVHHVLATFGTQEDAITWAMTTRHPSLAFGT